MKGRDRRATDPSDCACAFLRRQKGSPLTDPVLARARAERYLQLVDSGVVAAIISLVVLRDGSIHLSGHGDFGPGELAKIYQEIRILEAGLD